MPGSLPSRCCRGARRGAAGTAEGTLTSSRGRVVCAPNAFKGSLGAAAAAAAMARGAAAAGAEPILLPVADGGDGTLDVLLATVPTATTTRHPVQGPHGPLLSARLGWLDAATAVVELAEGCGLRRSNRRDALGATSRGAGELIAAAVDAGATSIIVGVGGSASTDGGAGLLQALGAELVDAAGRPLPPGGAGLARLARLRLDGVRRRLQGVQLRVACDVRNPLVGPDGAAPVFAPQKGADAAQVELLSRALERFAGVAERDAGAAGLADHPGAGAAGGAGYGLLLAGAELVPGAALVCDVVGVDRALAGAALALTGEGRLDAQTPLGKAPAEVALRSRAAGVPCAAIAGRIDDALPALFSRAVALETLAGATDTYRHAARLVARAAGDLVTLLVPAQ